MKTLIELYRQTSKHSNYQILPPGLNSYIPVAEIYTRSRFEAERFEWIRTHVDLQNKEIIDIGGNTGYFSFRCVQEGARLVQYYEGNVAHAEFVREATKVLHLQDKLTVHNAYYLFTGEQLTFDVMLLLNVLHHVGDDFGNRALTKSEAKNIIATNLQSLAKTVNSLVFQLGFNWKGDRAQCLFEHGTKSELIDFIRNASQDYWNIKYIAVPVRRDGLIEYLPLSESNIQRDDSLGEFLNRPLFLLESLRS